MKQAIAWPKRSTDVDVVAADHKVVFAANSRSFDVMRWADGLVTTVPTHFPAGDVSSNMTFASSMAVLPGGRFVLSSTSVISTPRFGVFDANGQPRGPVRTGAYGKCAASHSGEWVAASLDGKLALWSTNALEAGSAPVSVAAPLSAVTALSFSPTGDEVSWVENRTLFRVDVVKRSVRRTKLAVGDIADGSVLHFSMGADVIALSTGLRSALVSTRGKLVASFSIEDNWPVAFLSVSRSGDVIGCAGAAKEQWNETVVKRLRFPFPGMENGFVARFSPDGKLLAWRKRSRSTPRAMALLDDAVVVGTKGRAEFVAWPE